MLMHPPDNYLGTSMAKKIIKQKATQIVSPKTKKKQ